MKHKRLNFLILSELWERVRVAAFNERITITEFIRRAIEERLRKD